MRVFVDDKRLIGDSVRYCVDRESEREWHDCPNCYRETPTFVLTEIERTSPPVVAQRMRCCWECGAGIEVLR